MDKGFFLSLLFATSSYQTLLDEIPRKRKHRKLWLKKWFWEKLLSGCKIQSSSNSNYRIVMAV